MSRKYVGLATGMAAAAAVAMVVAGCSSSSSSSSSSGGTGSSTSTGSSASGKSMELIVGTKSDDFYVTMECGAEAEAKKLGVKLTVTGPATFSVPPQKPLIAAPTDSAALDSGLLKVQKDGTKVIFVDTSSANTAIGLSRISSDNAQG